MTGWDVLSEIMKSFPPIAAMLFFLAAGVVFAIGFSQHGVNFVKYGFKQKDVDDLSKKIDSLSAEVKTEISNLRTEFRTEMGDLRSEFHTEIDNLRNDLRTEFRTEMGDLRSEFHTELAAIKVNHFGHLKNFLCELTSILLDKNIINNTDKARLDNQLRDM